MRNPYWQAEVVDQLLMDEIEREYQRDADLYDLDIPGSDYLDRFNEEDQ